VRSRASEPSSLAAPPPDAAVAILHTGLPSGSVLLMRRSERPNDPWSGHWSCPGGRREPQDANLLHTALRELGEECGIHLPHHLPAAALPPAIARRRVGRFLSVAPFVLQVERELPVVLDPEEAVEARWVPLPDLYRTENHTLAPVPGLPNTTLFPVVAFHPVPLWGFTYRLLTEWLGLVPTDHSLRDAGFETATRLVDLLSASGCTLQHGWRPCPHEEHGFGPEVVKAAAVKEWIPVETVLARFAQPGPEVPQINLLEVRPEYVRVAGLAFEEYLIYSQRWKAPAVSGGVAQALPPARPSGVESGPAEL
jgi:ADP-ribose pyrophosphatase YjhB (NUDIX family)